jgi:hypothetical protein
MSERETPTIEQRHVEIFGRITYLYALSETGIKFIISALIEIDRVDFLVLSAPYSSRDTINVAKSITKLKYEKSEPNRDRLITLIGRYKSHSKIRNYIAHCFWTKGSKPDSIRPVYMSIGKGRAEPKGYSDGEKDWTFTELESTVVDLENLHRDIKLFMEDNNFTPE